MVEPLTRLAGPDRVMTRPPRIEAAIAEALKLDARALYALARTTTSDHKRLGLECLLHLVRRARRMRDDATMNVMFEVLIKRCEAILFSAIPDHRMGTAANLREEVLGQFGELVAADGSGDKPDELDFFECRFMKAFRAFYIDIIRPEMARLRHETAFPEPRRAEEDEDVSDDDVRARVYEAFRASPTQESAVLMRTLADAIDALPSDEREAVVLVHVLGYEEESTTDPGKQTAAKRAGVTGRTIRNRLKRAADKLRTFERDR